MKTENTFPPLERSLNVVLADDDVTDCLLFKEALDELKLTVNLTTVHDGDQLIDLLTKAQASIPDVVFLDLNMPRRSGYVALGLLKRYFNLLNLPFIIFSTVSDETKIKEVFRNAAHYYITKPSEFSELKKVI